MKALRRGFFIFPTDYENSEHFPREGIEPLIFGIDCILLTTKSAKFSRTFVNFPDSSIDIKLLNSFLGENGTNADNQCLVLRLDGNSTELVAVSCIEPQASYACEIRVQTVTYYAWFVANWFTFLLIFLLIVLVLSLCISMTMYSKKRDRVYRGRGRQLGDLPPSYSETQRKPVTQVTTD